MRPFAEGAGGTNHRGRRYGIGFRNAAEESCFMDEQPIMTRDNEERVRQGETGHHVRYILLASLALVIVLFILIAAFVH